MRLERRLDELRIGDAPAESGEDADVATLDESEAASAPGDLRELPREKTASFLAVEFRRLGEEERLAREIHPVSEHVRGYANVSRAGEEALDLLPARGERHRTVEHRDAPRVQPVHLAREREDGLATEGDDDGARSQRTERALADELQRELALEDLELDLRKRPLDERERIERTEEQDLAVLAREQQPRPRGAALGVVGPLHLVEDEELPDCGAISTVEQTTGARSLTRSSPVTSPTFSGPIRSPRRRCASCASIRNGPA